LLIKDDNAFVAAAAVGTPNPRRTAVAAQLQDRFAMDAAGHMYADTDADNARDFARFAQGSTEDIGNAYISAGLSALAIGGLIAGELGWTALMVEAIKGVL
jgi:hypothetical protein